MCEGAFVSGVTYVWSVTLINHLFLMHYTYIHTGEGRKLLFQLLEQENGRLNRLMYLSQDTVKQIEEAWQRQDEEAYTDKHRKLLQQHLQKQPLKMPQFHGNREGRQDYKKAAHEYGDWILKEEIPAPPPLSPPMAAAEGGLPTGMAACQLQKASSAEEAAAAWSNKEHEAAKGLIDLVFMDTTSPVKGEEGQQQEEDDDEEVRHHDGGDHHHHAEEYKDAGSFNSSNSSGSTKMDASLPTTPAANSSYSSSSASSTS